jgi:hypothetical protein
MMNIARLTVALLISLLSASANAHAFLDHASPRVGATVTARPAEVRLWFTQELEPAFSGLQVLDAAGKPVTTVRAEVDPKDRAQLHIALPELAPGLYTVSWRVVSVDTHVTEGKFTFRIAP